MLLKGVHWEDLNINMMIDLTIHKKLVQRRSLNLMLIKNCNTNVETALKPADAPNFGQNFEKVLKSSTIFLLFIKVKLISHAK